MVVIRGIVWRVFVMVFGDDDDDEEEGAMKEERVMRRGCTLTCC